MFQVSFWRQYQHGMLSLDSVRILVEGIEFSPTDEEYFNNLELIRENVEATGYLEYTTAIVSCKLTY